ncbi:MAG: hypothetical protein V3T02_04905 [Alphaproteobacteria bacterium]
MPIELLTSSSGAVPGPASSDVPSLNLWGKDGFTFADLLDFINPLQHIPVVSTIYRSLTGDEIGNAARIVGGAALGGVGGAVASLIDAGIEIATGKDIGGHVLGLIKDAGPTAEWQLAEVTGDGIENLDYNNAPETILVAENDTTYDQDIAAARASVSAENVASVAPPPTPPVNNAADPNGAALKESKAPASTAKGTPAPAQINARVVLPHGQAGSIPRAQPSPMASPNMAASSLAQAAFAGGTNLPAGSAFYAAEPANAVAALMATAKPNANPLAAGAQIPVAQTKVGQTGGQPFWLGLMAENADKAKSQNLIGAKTANTGSATVAAQQGKSLAQYRAAARLITSPGPAKQIYR